MDVRCPPAAPVERSWSAVDVLDAARAGPAIAAALDLPDPRCRVLDAKVEGRSKATVLYSFGDQLVLGRSNGSAATGRAIASLGITAWLFPDDPALPRLPEVLDPNGMADALESSLPACREGARLRRCIVEVVRYRPGRRATLKVSAWLLSPSQAPQRQTYFAKVYHDADKAASVHQVMRNLEGSRPVRDGRMRLPPVCAYVPAVPMLVFAPVPGTPLDPLLSPRDDAGAPDGRALLGVRAAASALAALHDVPSSAGRSRPAAREVARMAERARAVGLIDPDLGAAMGEVASSLGDAVGDLPDAVAGLHGDCKPSQFLIGHESAGVLDLDHVGPGDPATDVGTFTASLRQLAVWHSLGHRDAGSAHEHLDACRKAFVEEYVRHARPSDDFDRRLACHESVALLRKALRAFSRSHRSPLPAALTAAAAATARTLSRVSR